MLELRAASGSYGQIQAVRRIDLAVGNGEALVLLGRNGAGKSTVLKLLAGVLRPSTGHVLLDGSVIDDLPPERRLHRGIVLVPEGRGIFPGLTVEENLRSGAYWRRPNRKATAKQLAEIYEFMPQLAERTGQVAASLSGGEQQMVAIGRALMTEPRVLLLDEPSLGLAPQVVESLYELLARLVQRRISLVLVEQYAEMAQRVCTHAVLFDKGRVVTAGASADVVASPELVDVYLGGNGNGGRTQSNHQARTRA
jgi:branched-chain amino acid transport system ATP-binding protein